MCFAVVLMVFAIVNSADMNHFYKLRCTCARRFFRNNLKVKLLVVFTFILRQ